MRNFPLGLTSIIIGVLVLIVILGMISNGDCLGCFKVFHSLKIEH